MKTHDFDEPIERVGTDSYKWDHEGEGGKYIPLGVADTDFRAPREVIDAVMERARFGCTLTAICLSSASRRPCATGIKKGTALPWTRAWCAIPRG